MRTLHFGRETLAVCVATLMLAGCDASPAPDALSQNGLRTPLATNGDLLYVGVYQAVNVYSYPSGSLVERLSAIVPAGICVDSRQNVWIVDSSKAEILEYAHGGTSPIATLQDAGYQPFACSISPKNGDLAVSNTKNGQTQAPGSVSIYKGASGNPTVYADPQMADALFLAYDVAGNLFIDGYGRRGRSRQFMYAELTHGASHIVNLHVGLIPDPGDMHTSGQGIALEGGRGALGTVLIYRIVGSKIVGLTKCEFAGEGSEGGPQTFFIVGSGVLLDIEPIIYFYKYPAGGPPLGQLNLGVGSLFLAVSRGT